MKDIKTLYLAAKRRGKDKDLSLYSEAVNDLLKHHPNDFIVNLEYIISSDMNLSKLDEFVESYGLAIPACNRIITVLESCIEKCNDLHKDSKKFEEALSKFRNYRQSHRNSFDMYEYYRKDSVDNFDESYVANYYLFNSNNVQGRKLPVGMINKFGESAIPDTMITAKLIGGNGERALYEYLDTNANPSVKQWIVECYHEMDASNSLSQYCSIEKTSLSALVGEKQNEYNTALRESVILQIDDRSVQYTESDIQNILDLIYIREYQLTCMESADDAYRLQNEIYSLYESLNGITDENGNEIFEFTDVETDLKESRFSNTDNKYTGRIPSYLDRNHDLGWGENDKKPQSDEEEYRRPSAQPEDTSATNNQDEPIADGEGSDEEKEADKPESSAGVNNYYYYTYTNSLNKNSNSFNRDSSSHDDHSTNKGDNRTVTDDHSSNKRINSPNDDEHDESVKPWSLSISREPIMETAGDADDMKPQSDHPVKDALQDVDRTLVKTQQTMKKKVQDVAAAGSAFMKPVKRTHDWVMKLANDWKDSNETKVKEKLADPHARKGIFNAIGWCIKTGSLAKAGLLLNPVFLFLTVAKNSGKKSKERRICREMIGELKTELEIIETKIQDADKAGDNAAKYKLMRLKNEIKKKLVRIEGSDVRSWKKLL